jgi:hypothetical protein
MICFGCDDAEYSTKDNSVYIADAASSSKAATVFMEKMGADVNIIVRLAKKMERDTEVTLKLNSTLLQEYNKLNSTEYELLSGYRLPADAKVTIPAGDISASYRIHVDNFDTQGKNYALPVELGDVITGDVNKSVTQSKFMYLLAKPLIVPVPVMTGMQGKVTALPEEEWGIGVSQWSLECWVRMSAFSKNNQAIFNLGSSDHEIYIRFGDANKPYNYLQVKTLGGQVETARDFVANTWYHLAFVYDGTTFTIYRNGEQDVKFNPPSPKSGEVRMDFVQMICSGNYFPDKCGMSQVRLWKVARTPNQIKNNMFFTIQPGNPDLIAYWPMDEGSGLTFADITGNGHTATATSDHVITEWEQDVRFDK